MKKLTMVRSRLESEIEVRDQLSTKIHFWLFSFCMFLGLFTSCLSQQNLPLLRQDADRSYLLWAEHMLFLYVKDGGTEPLEVGVHQELDRPQFYSIMTHEMVSATNIVQN